MPLNKNILILIMLVTQLAFIPGNTTDHSNYRVKWIVMKGCSLRVDGSTNINSFSCIIPEYAEPDTLICYKSLGKDPVVPMSGRLSLMIFYFDCHNAMMTNDLRKTLKAKEFPKLNINFLSLNKFPELKSTQENISGLANIELAGITKKFEVSFKFSMDEQKIIHLIGTRSINFSDFNLTPPRKLGGMIQAKDKLNVEFYLNLKTVN